ncbi:MAG TPA: hypothetical protein VNN22_04465 [Verrucomicrobiae bacterium]|nr:hypothetical protein [Verrucomicrobiae bacterium]
MFGFFKHRPTQLSDEQYLTEFHRLIREVANQFAIGDTPYEQLVSSMGVIEKEMNHNGGCNWQEKDYVEYLDAIRDCLTGETRFKPDQLTKIRWSLDEIIACGRELEEIGESRRNATEAVDYLVARVVDWCQIHPRLNDGVQ